MITTVGMFWVLPTLHASKHFVHVILFNPHSNVGAHQYYYLYDAY
jgi:hypothetical protein